MRVSTPESEDAAAKALVDFKAHGWKKLVRKPPKCSQTHLKVLERGTRMQGGLPFTRLRLTPITGRTHQLRVHCAALGFPILGDPTYGLYGEANPFGGLSEVPSTIRVGPASQRREQSQERCAIETQKEWTKAHPPNDEPMCLHAATLQFEHPATSEMLTFEAPPRF